MAVYKVVFTIDQKGLREDKVERLVDLIRGLVETNLEVLSPQISVEKVDTTPPSRQARYDRAKALCDDAAGEIESLAEEMRSWYDSMPENFQNGDKGQQVSEVADRLEEYQQQLNDMEDLDFPPVFG